jgi:hypothetical protein
MNCGNTLTENISLGTPLQELRFRKAASEKPL